MGGGAAVGIAFAVLMTVCTTAPFLIVFVLVGWLVYAGYKRSLPSGDASPVGPTGATGNPSSSTGAGRVFGVGIGLVGAIACLLGGMLLVPAGGLYALNANLEANWALTTGTVTAMYTQESVDSQTGSRYTVYCPTVEFATGNGESLTVDVNDCSSPPAFQVGDPAELYYDPANPQNVLLKNSSLRTMGTIGTAVIGGLGLLCAVPGLVMMGIGLILAVRRRRSSG
jgi:hypothetical protein